MRELIIKRIEQLRDDKRYNAYRLMSKEYKNTSNYLGNDDWKQLDDEKLVEFFEVICFKAYG